MSEVIRRLNFEGVKKLAKFTNWDAKSGNGKNLLHVAIETKSGTGQSYLGKRYCRRDT